MSNFNCAFCRNQGATNEHEYKGDFIYVMCDGCDAQYKEHSQLGPKFVYCLCDPDNPRELEIGMAQSEINASEVATHIMADIEIEKPYVSQTNEDFNKTIKDEKKERKRKKMSNL